MDAVLERDWLHMGYASFTDDSTQTLDSLSAYVKSVNQTDIDSVKKGITDLQDYRDAIASYIRNFLAATIDRLPIVYKNNNISGMSTNDLLSWASNVSGDDRTRIGWAVSYLNQAKANPNSNPQGAGDFWKNNAANIGNTTDPISTFIPLANKAQAYIVMFQTDIDKLNADAAAKKAAADRAAQAAEDERQKQLADSITAAKNAAAAAINAQTQQQGQTAQIQQTQTQQKTTNTFKTIGLSVGALAVLLVLYKVLNKKGGAPAQAA